MTKPTGDILFKKESVFNKRKISIKNNLLFDESISILSKHFYQIPINRIKDRISFQRLYHISILLSGLFLSIMSLILINKFWDTDDWRLTFGYLILGFWIIILAYYFYRGRHFGLAEIETTSDPILISIKKSEFDVLKDRLQQNLKSNA